VNKTTFDCSGFANRICADLHAIGLEVAHIGEAIDQFNLQRSAQQLRISLAKLNHIKTEVDLGTGSMNERGERFVASISLDVAESVRAAAAVRLGELLVRFTPKEIARMDADPEDVAGTLSCSTMTFGLDLIRRDHAYDVWCAVEDHPVQLPQDEVAAELQSGPDQRRRTLTVLDGGKLKA
jgi:hypothetical protein